MGFSGFAAAESLPTLGEKPWLGFWVGYGAREFDFGISSVGVSELFLKEKSKGEIKRIHDSLAFRIYYLIEEEVGGKWHERTMDRQALESDLAESDDVEECSFVANYKGGTQAKISHRFEGDEVFISIESAQEDEKSEPHSGGRGVSGP